MSAIKETICVTGGSGFIRSWLVRFLLDRGYTVHVTAQNLQDDGETKHLEALESALTHLLDPASIVAALRGATGVFHLVSCFFLTRAASSSSLSPSCGRIILLVVNTTTTTCFTTRQTATTHDPPIAEPIISQCQIIVPISTSVKIGQNRAYNKPKLLPISIKRNSCICFSQAKKPPQLALPTFATECMSGFNFKNRMHERFG